MDWNTVSSTIRGALCDTLQFMSTKISVQDSNFNVCDKCQLIVILSGTKHATNSMFIGPKTTH